MWSVCGNEDVCMLVKLSLKMNLSVWHAISYQCVLKVLDCTNGEVGGNAVHVKLCVMCAC